MARNLDFSIDEYYHIYSRGTDKRIIFLDDQDYTRFQVLLYICNNTENIQLSAHRGRTSFEWFNISKLESLVDVGAYCLMGNHFHILIREKQLNGISIFMQKILTSYSMYFNRKYERTGNLFSGKFKSQHIDNDTYLKYMFSYVHLNPIKNKSESMNITNELGNYRYSSYLDYIRSRVEGNILNKESFPKYFPTINDINDELLQWFRRSDLH